jgi:hypothetical protein
MAGFMRGTISKGDYEKVRDLYAKNHPLMYHFYLLSPGGDVDEAIKIWRFFRKYFIGVTSPIRWPEGGFYLPIAESVKCEDQSCACASACALVWFGAPQRFGAAGLHRPRTEDPAFRALPPGQAVTLYRHKLDDVVRYLDEMEVPKPIIDAMTTTSSADIRWVDANKQGLEQAPSFGEWVDASCGRISTEEQEARSKLDARKSKLGADEKLLLKILTEKQTNHTICERNLLFSNRERLSRPWAIFLVKLARLASGAMIRYAALHRSLAAIGRYGSRVDGALARTF